MKTTCWDKMTTPMRKVWIKVSKRTGHRKTGLVKLQQEISSCDYEDVHILWDMLNRNEEDLTRSRKGLCSDFVEWAKHAPTLCRGG